MCYSDFYTIINQLAHMYADVIIIETSRSDMALLEVFDSYQHPKELVRVFMIFIHITFLV